MKNESDLSAGYADISAELDRAIAKFQEWPSDPLHAAAVVMEEAGELVKAVLEACYEPHKSNPADVRTEAIQVAAMAMRFLRSMNEYKFQAGVQHRQKWGCAACDRGDYMLGHADTCEQNGGDHE